MLTLCAVTSVILVVNVCSLSSDLSQCSINCSMEIGHFGSEKYGAGVQCWQLAVDEQDCSVAEQSPFVYFD